MACSGWYLNFHRRHLCFRVYRQHLGGAGVDLPGASAKVEGAMRNRTAVASRHGHMILAADAFFDGQIFDF